MKSFMRNKLFAKSKKTLALLLAAAMVVGGVPTSTVSAADNADVQTVAEVENTVDTMGTGDGAETGLIKYTLDTSAYEAWLKQSGYSTSAMYGTSNVGNWTWNISNVEDYVYVRENGVRLCSLYEFGNCTYKWQVKKGEVWEGTTMPTYTSEPGDYQILVEIPAVAEKSEAMKEAIPFTVTKAEMDVEAYWGNIEPGTLVKDVKLQSLSASYYVQGKGTDTYRMTEGTDSKLSATVAIIDAYTGQALAADTVLKQDGDYYVKVTPAFTSVVTEAEQARYTLPVVEQKLQMAGLIDTRLNVEMTSKWKDEDYTTSFDGEDVTAPVAGTDYSMVVEAYTYDAEKGWDWKAITPADGQVTYAWYEWQSESGLMEAAPVDAGTYYYGISYAGEAGMYESATAYIPVVVEKRELVLKPKWKEGAPAFYPGMSEADVLNWIDYDAEGALADFSKDHDWGTYTSSSYTFPYTPEFKLQVETGEGENKKFVDNNSALLQAGKVYRVIFTGNKGVYRLNGEYSRTYSINNYTGNADSNYEVNVESEVLEKNVVAVTVNPGTAAKIDVSAITPIVKTYDGLPLHEARALYKQAKVVKLDDASNVRVSDGTDKSLTYTWYEWIYDDEDGVPVYEEMMLNDYMLQYDPIVDAGKYMLRITYQDPSNEWHAAAADVPFEIKRQLIKVVPVSVPKALTKTYEYDYDYNEIVYEIHKVGTGDGTDGTGDGSDGGVIELREGRDYYMDDWKVEFTTKENPTEDDWYSFGGSFDKANSYRVAVDYFDLYNDNYVDYVEKKDAQGNVTGVEYFHETKAIELVEMGTGVLNIKPAEFATNTKVYDGAAWDVAANVEVTDASGAKVTDVELTYQWYEGDGMSSEWYDWEAYDYDWEPAAAPYRAGTYTLGVSFAGNEKYAAVDMVKVDTITITPKDLVVEAVVDAESAKAGNGYSSAYSYDEVKFDGAVERDAAAFAFDTYYWEYAAVSYINFYVYDKDGNRVSNNLKGDETYTLSAIPSLRSPYSDCYNVISKDVTFTVARGNAVVSAASYDSMYTSGITDKITGMDHVITPVAGVPFSYYAEFEGKEIPGNYVVLQIREPQEYYNGSHGSYYMDEDASYKSSIAAAGGYLLYEGSDYIYVAFDANAETKEYNFSINWVPGYTENFKVDCSKAILEDDLRTAVEPKSMSLISPAKKMVVGGTQQLDVKLTKKLMSDVISLGYSVDDPSVLCVTDYGYITALKIGKATVTVYPTYYNAATGKMEAIAGAKTAKVTINVANVSAPKIKKVQTWDYTAKVELPAVKDGYRREVYVLEGKGLTVDAFEQEIAKMEQQNWEGTKLVAAPKKTSYTSDGKTEYAYLENLDINKDYTVYVRNVSAIKNVTYCDHGCKVSEAHNGAVKSFKTTKSQVFALDVFYNDKQPVQRVRYYDEDEGSYYRNEVKLTAKTVTVSTQGAFWEDAKNPAADIQDAIWVTLPWDKTAKAAMKNDYVAPKLNYYVAARTTNRPATYYYYDSEEGYYYYPTSRATISKSGKMTLKAAGQVFVGVQDKTSGTWSEFEELWITVNPNKLTPNKVTMQVGQSMYVRSAVTYWEDKTKISGNFDRHAVLSEESKKALVESGMFKVTEYSSGTYITAIAPGKATNVAVTDELYNISATVGITVKDIAPVKSLKTIFVSDQLVQMSYSYNGNGNRIKVDVYDERGRLVDSSLETMSWDSDLKAYTFWLPTLVKSSKYTVQVSAVYTNEDDVYVESKAVKKAVKTTKIPVSYNNLDKDDWNTGIEIMEWNTFSSIQNVDFRTGNGYTLIAMSDNSTTADTLTWTSSNKKVATIKANANGNGAAFYSADLKALRSGWTTIEVKSKITKKVVARYEIYVSAVGNASSFTGDQMMIQSVEEK